MFININILNGQSLWTIHQNVQDIKYKQVFYVFPSEGAGNTDGCRSLNSHL